MSEPVVLDPALFDQIVDALAYAEEWLWPDSSAVMIGDYVRPQLVDALKALEMAHGRSYRLV